MKCKREVIRQNVLIVSVYETKYVRKIASSLPTLSLSFLIDQEQRINQALSKQKPC